MSNTFSGKRVHFKHKKPLTDDESGWDADSESEWDINPEDCGAIKEEIKEACKQSVCEQVGAAALREEEVGVALASEDLPALAYLPSQEWWRLFIDRSHQRYGGLLYDRQESPGYYASLMHTFREHLLPVSQTKPARLNADLYDKLHDCSLQHCHSKDAILKKDRSADSYNSFPTVCGSAYTPSAYQEVHEKRLDGWRLLSSIMDEGVKESLCVLGKIKNTEKYSGTINTRYGLDHAEELKGKIFTEHYQAIESPDLSDRQRLEIIADTVRTLHILHFFSDGNGRLNMFIIMNILLLEQGFVPAILPHDSEVFDGRKTKAELAEDIIGGMQMFSDLVYETTGRHLPEKYRDRIFSIDERGYWQSLTLEMRKSEARGGNPDRFFYAK